MIQFQVDEKRPELLDAVRKLDKLAGGGKINTHQVIIVETEDQELADIFALMLGPGRIGAKQDFVLMNQLVAEEPHELTVSRHPGIEISKNGGKTVATKRPTSAKAGENGNGQRSKTRKCAICGEEFEPSGRSQKICRKPDCKRALTKKYNQRYLSKKKIQAVVPGMEVAANAPAGPFEATTGSMG